MIPSGTDQLAVRGNALIYRWSRGTNLGAGSNTGWQPWRQETVWCARNSFADSRNQGVNWRVVPEQSENHEKP